MKLDQQTVGTHMHLVRKCLCNMNDIVLAIILVFHVFYNKVNHIFSLVLLLITSEVTENRGMEGEKVSQLSQGLKTLFTFLEGRTKQ